MPKARNPDSTSPRRILIDDDLYRRLETIADAMHITPYILANILLAASLQPERGEEWARLLSPDSTSRRETA